MKTIKIKIFDNISSNNRRLHVIIYAMRIQHLILLSQLLPFFTTRIMNKFSVPSEIAVRPWITYKHCFIKEVSNGK
jgi:valyl-tRNA synthetase